ncbi:MAG: asparagine synthase (glutamine-hydrolyzing) [Alphaproteobacteria bacterium]|nr:asparagine synthase (glutamine-hydrolyzing) [Alphaproteobacteria bacterium]
MCGIAGLMTRDGAPAPAAPLEAMAAVLRHRGPDGDGHYRCGDVGMVQTRLAIIDLVTGDQPLYEPAGAALVANAEIYNYLELRSELGCGRPAAFSTQSDCEPPLHLYRRYGLDFTAHLRGMYAIALHDPAAGHLVLTRDPFGIKPLYYAETPSALAFASQPSALIEAGIVSPQLVQSVRNELVQMQFTTGRETIFAGICRILPGETVVVRQGRIVERRRRGALPEGGPLAIDEQEALARLDAVIAESVRIHQRSDVPFGMFLSGGIDSTAMLLMMARLAERPLKAFTIGFAASDVADERPSARAAAQAVDAEHIEILFDEPDFWRWLPEIVSVIDDPVADYAILPTWALARAARQTGIKVILSGEGGDELFAGYGRYRSVVRPWWAGGRMPHARGVLDGLGILRGETAGWRDGIAAAEARSGGHRRTALQVAQAVDCADWLPNDLLVKLDRCLMAHGTEGRTPYLDTEVAALAFRLPDDLKIRRGLGKWLLRRWLADRLPEARAFARKRGLTVPVARWIARRADELGPLVARSAAIREICRPDAVERLFAAATHKRAARAAWNLLFYALWHRRHIERAALPPDTAAALAETL